MPLHEYKCQQCGFEEERIVKYKDADKQECPKCKSKFLRKKVSKSSFILKGGGWGSSGYQKE